MESLADIQTVTSLAREHSFLIIRSANMFSKSLTITIVIIILLQVISVDLTPIDFTSDVISVNSERVRVKRQVIKGLNKCSKGKTLIRINKRLSRCVPCTMIRGVCEITDYD